MSLGNSVHQEIGTLIRYLLEHSQITHRRNCFLYGVHGWLLSPGLQIGYIRPRSYCSIFFCNNVLCLIVQNSVFNSFTVGGTTTVPLVEPQGQCVKEYKYKLSGLVL